MEILEFIGNILRTFYSGYWLWLSIPFSAFMFFFIIYKIKMAFRKKRMKTWKINDIVYIKKNVTDGNYFYNLSSQKSSVGKPRGRLKKWNLHECLIELGDGSRHFIETELIQNNMADMREREADMEEFMEDNNGIKSKAERRDDAITSVIGKEEENV
jgi:hypothetical protein